MAERAGPHATEGWTEHARLPLRAETNGFAEEAIQTLEELRQAVRRFGRTYNQRWLIERRGYRRLRRASICSVRRQWHDLVHPAVR